MPSPMPECQHTDKDVVVYPASDAQVRLWLAEQIDGNAGAYVLVDALLLRGPLDAAALGAALDHLVDRHESLRTSFELLGGQLVQVVWPPGCRAVRLECCADPVRELDAVARDEVRRGFDTASTPLLRARLLPRGDEEHVLLLTMHHLVSDGWSLAVFKCELGALYRAERDGTGVPLAPPRLQYRDYAVWQRRTARSTPDRGALAACADRLADAPVAVAWQEPAPGAPAAGDAGARVAVEITPEAMVRARAAARRASCTEFMWLLAAYTSALAPHVADEDVVVGVPFANRPTSELEDLIGFFVNMVPIRIGELDTEDDRRLERVRAAALAALRHRSVPFEELVQRLRPARAPGRHPLFQVALALQNTPTARWAIPGLDVRPLQVDPGVTMYQATLFLEPADGGLTGYLEYDASGIPAAVAADVAAGVVGRANAA
jgi:hypothetical protein